jgi:hypothetical protein
MDRMQGSDARERSAATKVVTLYYEHNPICRQFFLSILESKLIDLRDGHLQPFAGAQLLLCLVKAMETSLDDQEAVFHRILVKAVLPLITYRYLNELLGPMAAVLLKFMGKSPQFGIPVLYALQRNWPLSTRAGSTARLAVAVFCGLDPQAARSLASPFLDFLAACLASPDTTVVAAALGIFERPNGREVVLVNAGEAIAKLYHRMSEILEQQWRYKLKEKVLACIDALAKANPEFFNAFVAREPPGEVRRPFPRREWKGITDLAAACNGAAVTATPMPDPADHAGITKIVSAGTHAQACGSPRQRGKSPPPAPGRPLLLLPASQTLSLRARSRSRILVGLPQPAEIPELAAPGAEREVW